MLDAELTTALVNLSSTFAQLSLHDFNHYTRNAGLSLAQMNILLHIHYQGPLEVTSFCEKMQISPAGASQMIERMVKEGVVERAGAPGDRRVRLVNLTEKGHHVAQDCIAARQAWISKLVETLPLEEKECILNSLRILNERTSGMKVCP